MPCYEEGGAAILCCNYTCISAFGATLGRREGLTSLRCVLHAGLFLISVHGLGLSKRQGTIVRNCGFHLILRRLSVSSKLRCSSKTACEILCVWLHVHNQVVKFFSQFHRAKCDSAISLYFVGDREQSFGVLCWWRSVVYCLPERVLPLTFFS